MIYTVNGQDIAPKDIDALFDLIQTHTGLDPGMAKAILHGGNPIKHPNFIVTARKE